MTSEPRPPLLVTSSERRTFAASGRATAWLERARAKPAFVHERRRGGTEIADGLRGLAILWVLCYHTWLFSWYTPSLRAFGASVPVDIFPRVGYLGVDLFFTISGFCLFLPVARTATTLRTFAVRRIAKIVPSYALVLIATIPFAIEYTHEPGALAFAFANHAAFVQNFFSDDLGQANSVFWTLAVEVQFYVVFPLVAIAFRRAPVLALVAMFALAFGYRAHVDACCLQVEVVTRQLPAYLDLFASGMFAAYVVTRLRSRASDTGRARLVATLGFAASVVAVYALLQSSNAIQYVPGGRERWDLYGRAGLALAFGCALASGCFTFPIVRRLVANPVLVFFSLVSYNLYLWHTLILIWMWKHGVPRASTPDPHADDHWKALYIPLGWAASIAVATAATYFVERPILARVRPHDFAFDWARLRVSARRAPATPETRT